MNESPFIACRDFVWFESYDFVITVPTKDMQTPPVASAGFQTGGGKLESQGGQVYNLFLNGKNIGSGTFRRRRFGTGHFGAGHFGAGTIEPQNFFFYSF